MWRVIHDTPPEYVPFKGLSRACLWDAYEVPVHNYIRQLQELGQEIRYCRGRYHRLWIKNLKAVKHHIMKEYEHCIDRIWNDQKAGTYFKKGERFEPHQVAKYNNLVMWDGLTRFTELMAQETSLYFTYKQMGTGIIPPTYNDSDLNNLVATVDMRVDGDINSDGMVLKDTATFPPGVPSNTISEFCAKDRNDSSGIMAYRVVIDRAEDRIGHIQSVTEVQESHSIVFQPVTNLEL